MRIERELLNLARNYRQMASVADDATASHFLMLAEDYEGHAHMLHSETQGD